MEYFCRKDPESLNTLGALKSNYTKVIVKGKTSLELNGADLRQGSKLEITSLNSHSAEI
jgi:hypothetical protein